MGGGEELSVSGWRREKGWSRGEELGSQAQGPGLRARGRQNPAPHSSLPPATHKMPAEKNSPPPVSLNPR